MTSSDPAASDPLAGLDAIDALARLDALTPDTLDAVMGDALDRVLNPTPDPAPEPDPTPPPPAREPTGQFGTGTAAELSDLEAGIKARKKAERDRFRAATDSEYWVALCFNSRAEKEQFLAKAGLLEHGDKYLDGQLVADLLGIDLEP